MSNAGTQPTLTTKGSGQIAVSGPVTFSTVSGLLAAGARAMGFNNGDSPENVVVDFAAVTKVDSACLALLLEWLRQSRAAGRNVRYTGLPEKLRAIARLSGVDELLNVGYSPDSVGATGTSSS